MDHKAEAKELVDRYNKLEIYISMEPRDIDGTIQSCIDNDLAKQCALIAINKAIEYANMIKPKGVCGYKSDEDLLLIKQEIENL